MEWRRQECMAENNMSHPSSVQRSHVPSAPRRSSTVVHAASDNDWNTKFQNLLLLPEDTTDEVIGKGLQSAAILGEFQSVVQSAVRTIIEEFALPTPLKTLLPVTGGGAYEMSLPMPSSENNDVHYIHRGLHFHLFDVLQSENSSENKVVHKSLGHEIRSTRFFLRALELERKQTTVKRPSSPKDGGLCTCMLECVVDYLGFRVFVSAPPDTNMNDSGQEVNGNVSLHVQMQDVARTLHLETGSDERASAAMHLCYDARLVKGTSDGRVYAARLCNLFPADLPKANELWMAKLRPELLASQEENMCFNPNAFRSDALAACGDYSTANQKVAELSQYLVQERIPAFAASLEMLEECPLSSKDLTVAMHAQGINVRHLPDLLQCTNVTYVRTLLLTEMIARACKSIFRGILNRVVRGFSLQKSSNLSPSRTASSENKEKLKTQLYLQLRQACVEFCNMVLGTSEENQSFYMENIAPAIAAKFGYTITETVFGELHTPQLFWAMQYHLNVSFVDAASYNFHSAAPLRLDHLRYVGMSTTMVTRALGTCSALMDNISALIDNGQESMAYLVVQLAISVEESCKLDQATPMTMASLLLHAAQVSYEVGQLEDAEKYLAASIEAMPVTHALAARCHAFRMQLLNAQYDSETDLEAMISDVKTSFTVAVDAITWHYGAGHPEMFAIYMILVDILEAREMHQEATVWLAEGSMHLGKAVGGSHVLMASPRFRMGALLQNLNCFEKAMTMYEDALRIYEVQLTNAEDGGELQQAYTSTAGECCFRMASMLMKSSRGDEAFRYALKSLSLRELYFSHESGSVLLSLLQLAELSQQLEEKLRAIEVTYLLFKKSGNEFL